MRLGTKMFAVASATALVFGLTAKIAPFAQRSPLSAHPVGSESKCALQRHCWQVLN